METVKVANYKTKVKGFLHQLTNWQDEVQKLEPFIEPFRQHREEHKGIIVESPRGFAIFTTGEFSYH